MRQQVADHRSAFAPLPKLPPRTEQLRILFDEGESLSRHERFGNDLPVHFHELRFRRKEFQLTWTSGHKQEDDLLGLRRNMPPARSHRIRPARRIAQRERRRSLRSREEISLRQQRRETERSEADAGVGEEVTPSCFAKKILFEVHVGGSCHRFTNHRQ